MNKDNLDKKEARCDVCRQPVWLDQYGNGEKCANCGWHQSEESVNHPDRAGILNIPSLNSARKLYKQGKALIADLDDFINAYKYYGEMEFTYNDIVYGVFAPKGTVILFESVSGKEIGYFQNIEEFRLKAKINGIFLKELWQDVQNTDFSIK